MENFLKLSEKQKIFFEINNKNPYICTGMDNMNIEY